jgi:hypothetical protein
MAAATTLATAGIIFPVLLAVRYGYRDGKPASVTSLLDMSKVSS